VATETRAKLRLRAETADELPALSALVQDMVIQARDVAWDPRARRLALVGNRYRWEEKAPRGPGTRVQSALRFDFVWRLQRRDWPEDPAGVLALLALLPVDDGIELAFSGGPALRLGTEVVDATLEDLGNAWTAGGRPAHP
jgi:hypothetical protein